MPVTETIYKTRSHTLPRLALLVYLMVMGGFSVMMLLILIGAGVWLSMAVYFAVILLIMGVFSGNAEFVLNEQGIARKVYPFLKVFNKEKITFHTWSEVASYKIGKDMNRSLQEYEFLWIRFKGGSAWQITDRQNAVEFERFKNNFLEIVNTINVKAEDHSIVEQHPIKRKYTFYEKNWSIIYVWVLSILTAGIFVFLLIHPDYISSTTLFRIAMIIIPGLAYIFYRISRNKKK